MRRAVSTWPPAAAIVTIAPGRSRVRGRSGIVPISFDPSGTAAWPRTRRFSVAHAVTTVRHPAAVFRLAARADFPSMATGTNPVASHAAAIHRPNAWANEPGASLAKTRPNVSALGTPL